VFYMQSETENRTPATEPNARASSTEAGRASARASSGDGISLRVLDAGDAPSLRRLAQLDSTSAPSGRLLGAEAGGTLIAVISLDDGDIVADPFRASAAAVELLQLRAGQLRGSARRKRRRRFRIPSIPRARGALAGSPPGGGSHLLQL